MKSIKSLIQELNVLRGTNEYKSLSLLDDHITNIEGRLVGLEERNLKYFCRAYSSTPFAVPSGAVTAIPLELTEHPQFGNMHSNTIENTKIWIRRNGVYHLSAGYWFTDHSGGTYRAVSIRCTGSRGVLPLCSHGMAPSAVNGVNLFNIACSYYLYIGDYVELTVFQDSGVNNNSVISYPRAPFLAVAERMEDLNPSEYGLLNPEANTR